MRWLILALGGVLILLSIPCGIGGWMLRDLFFKIHSEPSFLRAADLVARGPGDNHYVELSDFELGEPIEAVIYKDPRKYQPVYPKGGAQEGTPRFC